MSTTATALLVVAVAFGGTYLLMRPVIAWLDRQMVVDEPGHRSSHSKPTIRGGGLAMVLPVVVCWFVAADFGLARLVVSGGAIAGFALLGLRDDLGDLPVRLRLVLQFAFAIALSAAAVDDRLWLVAVGSVLVVAVVNAFNFMDGINGISGITLVCAGSAYAVQGWYLDAGALLLIGLAAAAAGAGFLPFNVPQAQVFLGDVGSYFSGAVLGLSAVLALDAGANAVAGLAPLALYGVDTAVTLARRIARGEKWFEAHREHTYQKLSDLFGSHLKTSLVVGVVTLLCAGAGLLGLDGDAARIALSTLAVAAVLIGYLSLPRVVRADG